VFVFHPPLCFSNFFKRKESGLLIRMILWNFGADYFKVPASTNAFNCFGGNTRIPFLAFFVLSPDFEAFNSVRLIDCTMASSSFAHDSSLAEYTAKKTVCLVSDME
jgi:hypothetical protein